MPGPDAAAAAARVAERVPAPVAAILDHLRANGHAAFTRAQKRNTTRPATIHAPDNSSESVDADT